MWTEGGNRWKENESTGMTCLYVSTCGILFWLTLHPTGLIIIEAMLMVSNCSFVLFSYRHIEVK